MRISLGAWLFLVMGMAMTAWGVHRHVNPAFKDAREPAPLGRRFA
jgi:hypothetical protein